jgi:hypothetical protein
MSCLLQSYMTAWSSEEVLQDFLLRRDTLVYTAVVPSFPTSSFRNDGIHANHNIFTRDDIHPANFREIAREQVSSSPKSPKRLTKVEMEKGGSNCLMQKAGRGGDVP